MSYKETINYLYSKLPMFSRIGEAAYKPDLRNTILLCERLNNPQLSFKSVHIAGTNGKGSCSHFLASIFQTAGYKTGLYTSPHIIDFKERIKIDGNEIEEQWVVSFVEKCKVFIEQINPSFFELTVAMAFSYFSEKKVDIAIIEVGLGGLLDSTNIILPELSIITNISLDHTNLLGNSLEEIAFQKAGIIKEKIPVVIGETQEEMKHVFMQKAQSMKSPIYFADQIYNIEHYELINHKLEIEMMHSQKKELHKLEIGLAGEYQLMNCKTICTAIDILNESDWKISETDVAQGFQNVAIQTGIRGRFELLQSKPKIIVDVAHNAAGLMAVFEQLKHWEYRSLHIITGFVKDKEVQHILRLFPKEAHYYFTQANMPRALNFMELKAKAKGFGLKGEGFPNVTEALVQSLSNVHDDDIILVIGSFFILADVYTYLDRNKKI